MSGASEKEEDNHAWFLDRKILGSVFILDHQPTSVLRCLRTRRARGSLGFRLLRFYLFCVFCAPDYLMSSVQDIYVIHMEEFRIAVIGIGYGGLISGMAFAKHGFRVDRRFKLKIYKNMI